LRFEIFIIDVFLSDQRRAKRERGNNFEGEVERWKDFRKKSETDPGTGTSLCCFVILLKNSVE